jgi:hypothetical protein
VTGNDIYGNNIGLNILSGIGSVAIYQNNIYGNTIKQIYSPVALEVSYNRQGNWWGRTTAPCFVAGTDSNRADVKDSYPFCVQDGWKCIDNDGDGYGIAGTNIGCVYPGIADCNDNNAAINPGVSDANCDGVDNNCDGIADDGYVPTVTSCGIGGCAAAGQLVCENGVTRDTCTPGEPTAEICDNVDNDCDGLVDADDSNMLITACDLQAGVCAGSQHIASQCSNGAWQQCTGSEYGSSYGEETCPDDGVDNNCDGNAVVDCAAACDKDGDGYKPDGAPWYCLYPFYKAGDCNDFNALINPGAEDSTCNGIDENCFNGADDGFITIITNCGVGACVSTGEITCQNGQLNADTCTPGTPIAEICDNIDNNCNNLTDDDVAQACYTGPSGTQGIGICKSGLQTCMAGEWGICTGEILPGQEMCNALDDDCNGLADDNILDVITDIFGYDNIGECRSQVERCTGGTP